MIAELGPGGEISFEGQVFRSPSAFSVFVKRKSNPNRKADDGWTSVKYRQNILSMYRPQLEALLAHGEVPSWVGASVPSTAQRQKRKPKPRTSPQEASDSDLSEEHVHQAPSDEVSSDDEYVYRTVQTTRSGRRTNGRKGLNSGARRSDSAAEVQTTWIQCQNTSCLKWRRVRCDEFPSTSFCCSMSSDPRCAAHTTVTCAQGRAAGPENDIFTPTSFICHSNVPRYANEAAAACRLVSFGHSMPLRRKFPAAELPACFKRPFASLRQAGTTTATRSRSWTTARLMCCWKRS